MHTFVRRFVHRAGIARHLVLVGRVPSRLQIFPASCAAGTRGSPLLPVEINLGACRATKPVDRVNYRQAPSECIQRRVTSVHALLNRSSQLVTRAKKSDGTCYSCANL